MKKAIRNIRKKTGHLSHRLAPKKIIQTGINRQVIKRLADKLGLVYFGMVDQRDDHRLVRGQTASTTHRDNHYSIGTVKGYDVVLLSRSDFDDSGKKTRPVNWIIITVDLKTGYDVPDFLVSNKAHDKALMVKYGDKHQLALGALGSYPTDFCDRYAVYGTQAHSIEVERILKPTVADIIDKYFGGVSVEFEDNVIYLYIENQRPSEALIGKALSNGLWLAETIYTITTDLQANPYGA